MACAIEDAGFEIRDSIHWVYGSGFPKSLDVSKAIDKKAGAEREVSGITKGAGIGGGNTFTDDNWKGIGRDHYERFDVPASEDGKQWEGWGTALKPAHEPFVVARKPLESTVAGNVLVWGTGGLNIDGCRVGIAPGDEPKAGHRTATFGTQDTVSGGDGSGGWQAASGRWPANVVFDRTAGEALDQQSGNLKPATSRTKRPDRGPFSTGAEALERDAVINDGGGGASRFFTQADFGPYDWPFVYQAKPSRKERNAGLDGLPEQRPDQRTTTGMGTFEEKGVAKQSNHHPTVKPVALMRHLVRLVTPPGGTVLDPFAGSGTTLVAAILERMVPLGCEMTDEYLPIIEGRMAWAHEQVAAARDAETNPAQPTLL
jgi:site-specific DNA-methyltransferase (adenine-specific)